LKVQVQGLLKVQGEMNVKSRFIAALVLTFIGHRKINTRHACAYFF
jgi:hypothetical protein